MKIVGPPSNNVAEIGSRAASGSPRARSSEKPAAAGDQVALSPKARWLAEWKAAIGDPLAVDESRVAELRQSIADGSFDPSPDEIAKALLGELATLRQK